MIRRTLAVMGLGTILGLLFATLLSPRPARGEDAPPELRAPPAKPTRTAKDISRPIIEATKTVRPAVVQIRTYRKEWGGRVREFKGGSGFIISKEGHVLTNSHVVSGGGGFLIEMHDGHTFERVKLLGQDMRSDVAVLKILDTKGKELPVATLGDSDTLEVGEIVIAIGSPYRLDSSVSMGIVSATGRTGVLGSGTAEEFIQTDAALNQGNSGGPLFNLDGQVVGINTAIQPHVEQTRFGTQALGGNVGIGFAVPINLVRSVATALIEEGVARRGRIGIYFTPQTDVLSRNRLSALGIDAQGGIRVQNVEPKSAAARAGIQAGDILTAVDGRALTDVSLLQARLAQAGPGGNVTATVYRAGHARDLKLELGEEPIATYGIEVETLTPRRASALGLPEDARGVIVTGIVEGSVADQKDPHNRLRTGDVIQQIATRQRYYQVRDKDEFTKVMAEFMFRPPALVQFYVRTKEGRFKVGFPTPPGRS